VSIFMDRFIGLFSFIAIALLAVLISWNAIDPMLRRSIMVLAAGSGMVLLVALNGAVAKVILKMLSRFKLWNIGERISKIYRAVHEYRDRKRLVFTVFLISLGAQSIYFAVVYLFAKSLGTDLLLRSVLLIMPIVSVISMLPSIGGLGIREGAMVILFTPLIGSDNAFSLSILVLASLLANSLAGAIIYLSAAQFKIKKEDISRLDAYSV
ncbi:lysylphosphatidylglycerol synthase domain-containing protein, partial [Candidatus Omnitrophota bacterium]